MTELTRRRVLLSAAGVGTAALAGCVSNGDTDDENAGGSGEEAAIEEYTISYVGSDCAGPEPDAVTVVVDEESYTIEGTLPAPTPCYEPELVAAELTEDELSVTVDVVEDSDDEECVECAGEVSYDAVVELAESAEVERVTVTHESGEELTVEAEQFHTDRPELLDSEIETTRQDARGDDTEATAVDVSDDSVTITGTIETSTPHYEATLEDAAIDRQTLQVTVDVESTLDDDEAGTTELGVIEYEATVDVQHGDAIEGVTIDHPETSHGVESDEIAEGDSY